MMKIVSTASWVAAIVVASSLAIVMPAFAQTGVSVGVSAQAGIHNGANGGMRRGGMMPGVFGTVTAVSGNTLTVAANAWPKASSTTQTAYAVDATNAKIYKGNASTTVSISSVAVGDSVMVQGTVSGTNVTATVIRDGFAGAAGKPGMQPGRNFTRGASSSTPPVSPITGNGEPVVGGTITAISGNTLTVTNASNVTYTIDVSSATIVKNGTSTALANLSTGESVVVQGTVNGTSVTASSVLDQGVKAASASSTAKSGGGGFGFGGIFGAIGGFFQHLFGF
jgi:hypothetical protein